jgi:hypothetical protein
MPGSFEMFINGLADREYGEAEGILTDQLGTWQNIRLSQASRARPSRYLPERT